jgi:hypothetical protein
VSSQRAGERANGRRPGAFEARRLHVGRLRRMQREVRCECTGTHARRHGSSQQNDMPDGTIRAQRIGGHHGRVSSQTGCATPITADALTGPK